MIYFITGILAMIVAFPTHYMMKWACWKEELSYRNWSEPQLKPLKTGTTILYVIGCLVFGPVALALVSLALVVAIIMCVVSMTKDESDGWWNRPFVDMVRPLWRKS